MEEKRAICKHFATLSEKSARIRRAKPGLGDELCLHLAAISGCALIGERTEREFGPHPETPRTYRNDAYVLVDLVLKNIAYN